MPSPTVSVIIPTYRHRDYVEATVQSVLAQTHTDFEVIVINDGSPDDTATVLRPFVESGAIQYLEQPNAGQAAARNRGIALARGEFIALLDDDDLWPPDRLESQVTALKDKPDAVMVYGFHQKIGEETSGLLENNLPVSRTFEDFAAYSPLVSPGQALFRTDAVRRIGGCDTALFGTDDWDLYLRLAREGPILYDNRLALHYRVHPSNASKNYWRMYRNSMRVVEKHFPRRTNPKLRALAVDNVRRYVAQAGVNQALNLKRAGRTLQMLIELAKVVWIRPAILWPRDLPRRLRTMSAYRKPD